MSIEKLLRAAERYLKRTEAYQDNRELDMPPEENYQVDYLCIKGSRDAPEDVLAYASCIDEMLCFHPMQEDSRPIHMTDWQYGLDDDLFAHLENSYTLAYMSWETHGYVWEELSEYPNSFQHAAGMQSYLEFCRRGSVTRERLEKECGYDGVDVMPLYNRQAAKSEPKKPPKDLER